MVMKLKDACSLEGRMTNLDSVLKSRDIILPTEIYTICEYSDIADIRAARVTLVVKNPPANAGDVRDVGSIPGSRRYLRGGHGNAVQYSCLENSTDRGA